MIDPLVASVFGGVLTALGGLASAFAFGTGRDLSAMRDTPNSRAADLATHAPGSQVKVSGVLRSDAALTSAYAGRTCAWFEAQEIHEVRDPDGSSRPGAGREDRISESITRSAPCRIEDASGAVALVLDGAKVDGLRTLQEREELTAFSLGFGGVQFFGPSRRPGVTSEVYAVRREETILEIDAPIYTLAVVRADGSLGAAEKGGRGRFLVSRRTESEFARRKCIEHRVLVAASAAMVSCGGVALGLASLEWLTQ